MKNENLHFYAVCRGIFTVICFVIVSSLTTFYIRSAYVAGSSVFVGFEPFVANIFSAIMYPFIFNSFATAFAYSDRSAIDDYLSREDGDVSFRKEIKYQFTSTRFLTEFITVILTVAFCSYVGLFSALVGMFPPSISVGGWFPTAVLLPICSVSLIFSKYEAARYFEKLKEEHDLEKVQKPSWFLIRLVLLAICYPICAPMTPIVAFTVFSLFSVFAKISAILTVLGTIAAFIILALIIRGIRILKSMYSRRKFMLNLTEAVKNKGFEIRDLKNPYASVRTSKKPCSFTLVAENAEYDCIVISTVKFRTPLVFTSPTDAHFLHRAGTDKHNFSIQNNIEFYHKGTGKKIIIVNPSPKHVFVTENKNIKRVQCGDTIWGITVYDAESFIGCMDRDCL